MTSERQMLSIAAVERTQMRLALSECILALSTLRDRNPHSPFFWPEEPGGRALNHAQMVLAPKEGRRQADANQMEMQLFVAVRKIA